MSEELTLLKERADIMGVTYHPNIGIEALKAKVEKHLKDEKPEPEEAPVIKAEAAPALTKAEMEQAIRESQIASQLKLVRIRITCLNPQKAHVHGEIITVGNRYVGTVRKFVPFGEQTDDGYHVPYIIYNELKNRKFNSVKIMNGKNGSSIPQSRLVPEFAIEVLEQLTPAQLEQLARAQAAADNAA